MLRRGARGMDAERGAMGQGWPFATPPGAAPEGGKFCEAKPGCGGGLLFGYFFLATQEKVTRPAGRKPMLSQPRQIEVLHELKSFHHGSTRRRRIAPFRRPSAGGVEGVERHGCRESRDGPGMALRGGPLKRRRSEGTPAQPGPDAGASVFGYFSAFGKSDSPSRAKPVLQPTRGTGPLLTQSPKASRASSFLRKTTI